MTVTPGQHLRRLREAAGYSREELAAHVSGLVTASAITQYEDGRIKQPKRHILVAIDQALAAEGSLLAAYGQQVKRSAFATDDQLAALQAQVDALLVRVERLAAVVETMGAVTMRTSRPGRRAAGQSSS